MTDVHVTNVKYTLTNFICLRGLMYKHIFMKILLTAMMYVVHSESQCLYIFSNISAGILPITRVVLASKVLIVNILCSHKNSLVTFQSIQFTIS